MVHFFIWMSEFTKSHYKAAAMTGNYKLTQSQVNTPIHVLAKLITGQATTTVSTRISNVLLWISYFPHDESSTDFWWYLEFPSSNILVWILHQIFQNFQMHSDETLMLPSGLHALWCLPFFTHLKFTFRLTHT